MAMTPQERAEMNQLKALVQSLYRVENVEFIANINRRITFPSLQIGDLSDVSSTTPSSGQVLKYNGSEWAPGTDNTGP